MNFRDYLITNKNAWFQVSVQDWKEAVRIGTDILMKDGVVDENYCQAIIENTEKLGPYYLLAPGIAMPHAKTECGVKKMGYSLLTLSEGVEFGDEYNDPIDIVVTMAATSEEENEEAIEQIADLLGDEDAVNRLRQATSYEELDAIFKSLD